MRNLQFGDCLLDSPWHRASLREHELRLQQAAKALKRVEGQCRDLVSAAQKLSTAQRSFAESVSELSVFVTAEDGAGDSVDGLAQMVSQVEEEREKILSEAQELLTHRLHQFRTEQLGRVLGEERKSFEKKSRSYYSLLEKQLSLSGAQSTRDAEAELELSRRAFHAQSLDYVGALQALEDRLDFQLMDALSSFLYSFLSFYHIGSRIHEDFKPQLDSVVQRVEKAKASFQAAQLETQSMIFGSISTTAR